MALTLYNVKKWYRMITGNSVLHVNQDIGKCFSTDEVKGYYNNLTEKVRMQPELLGNDSLPTIETTDGRKVIFPVAIFQYGLGAYDLFLQTGDDIYKQKFLQCVEWTSKHQEQTGAWKNFSHIYPDNPYGAMAQGEATSLLVRAYTCTGKEQYLEQAKASIDFMLKPVGDGGTTLYQDDELVLLEYTHKSAVMNGWVFAWFGLYDYELATDGQSGYHTAMQQSLETLKKYLPRFSNSFWSMYDLDGHIASPFYHNLHIAQMQALYKMTGQEVFQQYARKWEADSKAPLKKGKAFLIKAWQKIKEKKNA
jgi:hypothetical protein